MKQLFMFFLLIPGMTFAQWNIVPGFPETFNYLNVQFYNRTHGAIVYDAGNQQFGLFVTTDGGQSWIKKPFPFLVNRFDDIQVLNDSTIYITGYGEGFDLNKSFDFGNTWQFTSDSIAPFAFHYLSQDTGYCTGWDFTKTTDGGESSQIVIPLVTYSGNGNIHFPTKTKGYVLNAYYPQVSINYTNDGGETWIRKFDFYGGYDVYAPSENVAFISSSTRAIFRTTDGGVTWDSSSTPVPSLQLMHSIYSYDTVNCVSVGTNGTIVSTSNGLNWREDVSGTINNLHSVSCSRDYYYAVGDSGIVLQRSIYTTMQEYSSRQSLLLHPNPVLPASMFTIPAKEVGTVVVYSLSGQELSSQQISKQNRNILSPEASGVYMVVVYNKQQQIVGSSQLMVTE